MTTGLTSAGQLDARLRGDERKALAFCDWALGSPERATAVATAWLAQWHTLGTMNADASPTSRGMLWRPLLTRMPAQAPALAEASPEFEDLAMLPLPARTAVLLTLLGLTAEDSAEAMRLSMHAHSERLNAGVPRLADGSVDGTRWQAWSRAITAYVEHLPLSRTAPLVQARMSGEVVAAADEEGDEGLKRTTRRNLMLVGVVCATLLALTFVPSVQERINDHSVRVETRQLDDLPVITQAAAPARAVTPVSLAPEVQDLAFYAWYAQQTQHAHPKYAPEPTAIETNGALPETEDAP